MNIFQFPVPPTPETSSPKTVSSAINLSIILPLRLVLWVSGSHNQRYFMPSKVSTSFRTRFSGMFSQLYFWFCCHPNSPSAFFSSDSLVVTILISFRWRLFYLHKTWTHWSVWTDHPGECRSSCFVFIFIWASSLKRYIKHGSQWCVFSITGGKKPELMLLTYL